MMDPKPEPDEELSDFDRRMRSLVVVDPAELDEEEPDETQSEE